MIKAILFDLDDTLFSLSGCEAQALRHTLGCAGLLEALPADFIQRYAAISSGYWAARTADGSMRHTRAQIIELSWRDFPGALRPGRQPSAKARRGLLGGFLRIQRAEPRRARIVENLAGQYRLGMVTNGYSDSQRGRLAAAGWGDRFDPLLISEEVGVAKPDPRIFQLALDQLGLGAADALYVGDSLSHDREGCLRAGIRFCHYCPDPARGTGAPKCDYRIRNLLDLERLLRALA